MSKYVIDGETLKGIADAIRTKKGTEEPILTESFAEEIKGIDEEILKGLIECREIDLVIPHGITKLGDLLFCHKANIKSIRLPSTLTSIGGAVFERGRGLKEITVPDSVIEMGNYVFYGHYDLEKIVIGDGVPMITHQCFYDCASLKTVILGSGITVVSQYAFDNCTNCLTYDFSRCKIIPNLVNLDAFRGINANARIIVPQSLYLSWGMATNWLDLTHYIVSKGQANINTPVSNSEIWIYGDFSWGYAEDTSGVSAYCQRDGGTRDNLYNYGLSLSCDPYNNGYDFKIYGDATFTEAGTYEIWVENASGVKVYRRILEVS